MRRNMTKNLTATITPIINPIRTFPFKAGTNYKNSDESHAISSLKIFRVLWQAVKDGSLTLDDIGDIYFYSISKTITYRDSWKRGKFWSENAWIASKKHGTTSHLGLKSEHVLPRRAVLEYALTLSSVEEAILFVEAMSFDCIVTTEENNVLTKNGLNSKGFATDPWLRYKGTGIKILNIQHPFGFKFLNEIDVETLKRHDLLSNTIEDSKNCMCELCIKK
jgi:hypothetical protein